ncbi:MAG: type 4a pilus biogenesis protein PilO [Deltaproteobacteria bacterium]|nr:type 4a pilus biogenesis protein PilO [Deltaproteobacteria bacterium]
MAIDLDDIRRLSGGKKLMILLGVLLLLGYFYWFYFLQPVSERKTQLGETLETMGRQIATRQNVVGQIERHRKEIAVLKMDLETILAKLPEQKEIPHLLTSVSEAGRNAGLDFILFEPMAPVPKEFYAEIPVKIAVAGRYNDIAVFFDSVAHLPRIATITDVAIKKGTGRDALLQADCLMKIYMFLEETANEKPDEEKK